THATVWYLFSDSRLGKAASDFIDSTIAKGDHIAVSEKVEKIRNAINVSVVEKGLEIAAAMYEAKDKHFHVFNTVNDDILPHSHAAASGAEIVIAGTSDVGEAREHEKAVAE